MSSGNSQSVVVTVAAVATALAASLPLLQMDSVSRLFLSPDRLEAKRRAEYRYRWNHSVEKRMYLNREKHEFSESNEFVELLTTQEEISNMLPSLLETPYALVAIEMDEKDERAKREYFLYIIVGDIKYQLPVITFGLALADFMEEQLTSTAMCFIADATGGGGSSMLATLAEDSKAGVAIVREPLWMSWIAWIASKRIIANSKLERILLGLARLDAWNVRDAVGAARTVVFTLPGQATTATLLPLLQNAFPCERHLFVYDSLVGTIQNINVNKRKRMSLEIETVTSTTPLTKVPKSSARGLSQALSKLSIKQADIAESWVSSIDGFLAMKNKEKENNYLPFVFKLNNILEGSLDDVESDRRLALTNVLQFMTGSRSRPLVEGVLDAAVESLRDLAKARTDNFDKLGKISNFSGLEAVAFCHHGILIQDKTLLDTVKPAKEWTLKAARKISGCLCCGPEEEDDEEEENNGESESKPASMMNGIDMSQPGAFALALSATANNTTSSQERPKFVDGKSAFAFDPNQFST
jgi:hypothetical protein|mmetsp:Transcript_2126/g.3251  ORF Transcript_2126/g.3251 Transcript_2126/m.3251 type:complete len:527 (+) Transcript_2126:174-1754(+)|eukprot:CAMPEP_0195293334 /NCGR_PEP_ID=MMETSP0707-20130614/12192_1 /TAXON_ID=33640 /ORGANISM="Asterionellopsis glacialis, Strain CCMP134" /LENGTH=526 /DNA_ID=CAMNT_0040354019 /DNA_START=81 /DNA_END=1661 /DNA_ORIENTATION=+